MIEKSTKTCEKNKGKDTYLYGDDAQQIHHVCMK